VIAVTGSSYPGVVGLALLVGLILLLFQIRVVLGKHRDAGWPLYVSDNKNAEIAVAVVYAIFVLLAVVTLISEI
jgi:hypothetical protein